jgi:hypothetical protein
MPFRVIRALSLACLLAGTTAIDAATYTVAPKFVAAFANDGSFEPIGGYDLSSGDPALLQLAIEISFDDFAPPAVGFAAGNFDVALEGLTYLSGLGLGMPVFPSVDTNGPGIPGGLAPLIIRVEDLGAPDLQDVLVWVSAGDLTTNVAVDPRYRVGQVAPVEIGNVFLDFPGGAASVSAAFRQVAYFRPDPSNPSRHIQVIDSSPTLVVSSLNIGVPEPTSAAVAVIGVLAVCWRSRE